DSAGGGGGATDIRLVSGAWNNTASLRSRIMVAAGGSGSSWSSRSAGGALTSSAVCSNVGATQTSGNAFGIGGTGVNFSIIPSSGGGGGYYGGFATHDGSSACQSG